MQLSKPVVPCGQSSEPERGRTRARLCDQLANTADISQGNRERLGSFNGFLSGRGGSQYGGGTQPRPRPQPTPPAKPEPKVPKPNMKGWWHVRNALDMLHLQERYQSGLEQRSMPYLRATYPMPAVLHLQTVKTHLTEMR
ncbi:hypothetical protein LTR56_000721 [Elasticomyces elasticus]|nr:hypothetical protein LTR22_013592 [Elasticomyces elasticus]KAK3660345.1 hypothetical protein LTR56_000721 [Elasticomyces elasticus]KAK4929263.1 hypothetical protein LTR49_004160 [Elasticomyces elasticus]KAK5765819.1 hypothetical protein LTS12_004079 [Elasticomyces elasticus]